MSHLPTTTAAVTYLGSQEFDEAAPGIQIWTIEVKVDGPSPAIATEIRFPGSATGAQKKAAVREIVNAHIGAYEPGVPPLADIAIQISGQPV